MNRPSVRRVGEADLERVGIAGLVPAGARLSDLGKPGADLSRLVSDRLYTMARESGLVLFVRVEDCVESAHVGAAIVKAWMQLGYFASWLHREQFERLAGEDSPDPDPYRVPCLAIANFYTAERFEHTEFAYSEPSRLVLRARRRPGRLTILCSDRPLANLRKGFAPGLESWLRRSATEILMTGCKDPNAR